MTSTDIHQHLWPPSFFSALAKRSQPPRLRGRSLELVDAPAWRLDVVFAILAGGAAIQLERMAARGVDERSAMLPHIWFDMATYGRRALDLAMSTFGVEPMLFGTDIPIVDPEPALDVVRSFGEAVTGAVLSTNSDRLLRI